MIMRHLNYLCFGVLQVLHHKRDIHICVGELELNVSLVLRRSRHRSGWLCLLSHAEQTYLLPAGEDLIFIFFKQGALQTSFAEQQNVQMFFLILHRVHVESATLHIEGTEDLFLHSVSRGNDASILCWFDCVNVSHC